MTLSVETARVLARCNGFRVTADGEVVGVVATPVFSGTLLIPDYLLIRVTGAIPGAYRAITPEVIAAADPRSETVVLGIAPEAVALMPDVNLSPS
jgi:hypothetical protein